MVSTDAPATSPPREDAISGTYAIRVTETDIQVWQWRVTVAHPDGEWQFVETLHRDDDPRLSLEYAELTTSADDGHWVYSRSYDCEIDCR